MSRRRAEEKEGQQQHPPSRQQAVVVWIRIFCSFCLFCFLYFRHDHISIFSQLSTAVFNHVPPPHPSPSRAQPPLSCLGPAPNNTEHDTLQPGASHNQPRYVRRWIDGQRMEGGLSFKKGTKAVCARRTAVTYFLFHTTRGGRSEKQQST